MVNPALYPKLPYDTLKDLDGVTLLATPAQRAGHRRRASFKDVADLVAKAKAKPGGLQYASAGNGSATHMNAEQFKLRRRPGRAAHPLPRHARKR